MTEPGSASTRAADWRAERLARLRALIARAAPHAVEEAKWKKPSNPSGVPTWSDHGILCTCETYREKVKITFAKGAALSDPQGLFNASLDGKVRRAIDLERSDTLDERAFVALVRAAVARNRGDAPG